MRWEFGKKKKTSQPTPTSTAVPSGNAAVATISTPRQKEATKPAQRTTVASSNTVASPVLTSANAKRRETTVASPPDRPHHEHEPILGSKTEVWLGRAAFFLSIIKSTADGAGLVPLKGACEGVVTILDAVQAVTENRSAWRELIRSIKTHLNAFQKQLDQVGINDILEEVEPPLSGSVKEYQDTISELLADVFAESGITDSDIQSNKMTLQGLVRRVGITQLESGVIRDYQRRLESAKLGILQSLLLYIASSVGNSEDSSILNELKIVELRHTPRPRECADETRRDVLETCKAWSLDVDAPNILWIKGYPGTGKSAIASSLVSELGIKRSRLGSSFFFQRQNSRATTHALWRTVAYDLAPTVRKSLSAKMRTEEIDLATPSINIFFRQLIHDPLMKIEHIPVEQSPIVVIDALDECGGLDGHRSVERKNLIRTLDIWSKLPSNFKLIVTSREESDIARLFAQTQPKTIELLAGDSTDHQSTLDIRTFLASEFRDVVVGYETLPADWPSSGVIEKLAVRAGGLFIWASTVVKFIATGEPQSQLRQILSGKGVIGDMSALYAQVLHTSFPVLNEELMQNLRSIFGAIIVAKEPFTRSSIAGLLSISESAVEHTCRGLQSLMEYRDNLRFHHQSFVDFLLLDPLDPGTSASEFTISFIAAHEMLTSRCLKIMKNELRFNICDFESSYMRNVDIPNLQSRLERCISPHLFYAARFWTIHLEWNSPNVEILQAVHYFLANQFLFWLEVISLHGLVNRGVNILTTLIKWLKKHGQGELGAVADDMPRFIAHFSIPISESVPHIYLSTIPFVPKKSPIAKLYNPRYPHTLSIQQGGDSKWDSNLALNTLLGHAGVVWSVSFSPDGRFIVSGSDDRTVRLWDMETGHQLSTSFEGHSNRVISVAFSPDGRRIVSGSDKTVRIWDVETGQHLASLNGHSNVVWSTAFSPDNRRVVSGSFDKTVRIWDVDTGQQLGPSLEGHSGIVKCVIFSPDGQQVISCSDDRTIRIWDADTGQQLESLEGHTREVNCVALSPDGQRLVSGCDDESVFIWDMKTGQQLGSPLKGHSGFVKCIAFSPDGHCIASGSSDGTMRLWDVETGLQLGSVLEGHGDWVRSVGFSPDGRYLVSGCKDKTVRIWDVETYQKPVSPLDSGSGFVLPDDQHFVSRPNTETSQMRGEKAGKQVRSSPEGHDDCIWSFSFSSDGKRFVSASADKTVRIWDVGTGQQLGASLEGHSQEIHSVSFSPDDRLVVSGSFDNTARIWDVETSQQLGPALEHNGYVTCVAFSPDDQYIVSSCSDKTMRMWSVAMGQQIGSPLKGHTGWINSFVVSPDGQRVISSSADKTVRIWDVKTGQQLGPSLEGHRHSVMSVAVSPDGRCIASGSADKTLRIWDAETAQQLGSPLEGHSDRARSVAFSPDGRRLVSGSDDCTVRIWDVETGQQLGYSLDHHTRYVLSVDFSPDGRYIVSGSYDRTMRVWDIQSLKSIGTNFDDGSHMVNGWVHALNSRRLFWVPASLRAGLLRPPQTLIIGHCLKTRLDMSKFVHGEAWTKIRGD
ncbi:hypothetical protein FS842_005878 [Serendipita sp. 407]|nr:hypothetical protein FS842_005878 [Serendipita sp. 407]